MAEVCTSVLAARVTQVTMARSASVMRQTLDLAIMTEHVAGKRSTLIIMSLSDTLGKCFPIFDLLLLESWCLYCIGTSQAQCAVVAETACAACVTAGQWEVIPADATLASIVTVTTLTVPGTVTCCVEVLSGASVSVASVDARATGLGRIGRATVTAEQTPALLPTGSVLYMIW